MKLSEKLQQIHDSGDVGLYVESLIDEAKFIESVVDSLTDENRRLDLCLASKTDIANNLKDELLDFFMREMDTKQKHDQALDKYLRLKFQVEKMLRNGDLYFGMNGYNAKSNFRDAELEVKRIIDWQGEL